MTSWEFLLQKEGDRTWLPLENLTVEILEGRYRVVARTPHQNQEIDIYVSYVSSEDNPPKRRVQQRTGQSNGEGLLAILPFTPFRPGRWELRCRPHVKAGDPAQQWHSQIQLQVLPQSSAEDEDLFGWDPPTSAPREAAQSEQPAAQSPQAPEPTQQPIEAPQPKESDPAITTPSRETDPINSSEIDTSAPNSDPELQQLANEMSQMVMESVMGVALPPDTPTPQSTNRQPPQLAIALANSLLVMDNAVPEQALIPSPTENSGRSKMSGRNVTVVGEIIGVAASHPLPELVLTLELRDPSSKEIWSSARDSFPPGPLPLAFSQQLTLPEACRSQLLLGNATLWYTSTTGQLTQLTSSDFNVMVPVGELLSQAQPNQAPSPPEILPAETTSDAVQTLQQQAASNFLVNKFGKTPQPSKGNAQLNTELLSLLKPTEQRLDSTPAQPSTGRQSYSDRPSPSLPKFGNPPPTTMAAASNAPPSPDQPGQGQPGWENSDAIFTLSAEEPQGEVCAATSTVEMEAVYSSDDPIGELTAMDNMAEGLATEIYPTETYPDAETRALVAPGDYSYSNDDSYPTNAEELSPEDNPFALPEDSELMDLDALLGSSLATSSETTSPNQATETNPATISASFELAPLSQPTRPSLDIFSPNHAIQSEGSSFTNEVVVDDELDDVSKQNWMKASLTPSEEIDPNLVVPLPELIIPDKPLVQGETLRIQVRVAPQPGHLCARVWLLDCQSRSLLGEPQWITAFLPLNDNWVEANVDIVIPDGSIEVQFEAIAIEPTSQRESLKISTRRPVQLPTEPAPPETW